MILKASRTKVILETGSQSIDVTNVPVRKLITPVVPINPKEQSCKKELVARLAQDQEELEQMWIELGKYHPVEQ